MSYNLEANAPPSRIIYMNSLDAPVNGQYNSFINSRPLTSDFTYDFPVAIAIPENIDTLISLNSASIPYSFYNVRSGINDVIDFNMRRMFSGGVPTTPPLDLNQPTSTLLVSSITIPAGNYTINSLYTTIIYYLRIAIGSYDAPNPFGDGNRQTINFRFYYDRIKQKSILSFLPTWNSGVTAEGNGVVFTFLPNIGVNKHRALYKEIGLELNDIQNFYIKDSVRTGTTEFEVGTIDLGFNYTSNIPSTTLNPQLEYMFLSPSAVDISGVRGVYIRTNLTSVGTLDTQTGNFSAILSRVPINVNAGDVIFLESANDNHKTIVNMDFIKTIRVRITDERNRLLDLNGLQFQIAIQFDFVYNKPQIEPLDKQSRRLYSHYLERERVLDHQRNMESKDVAKKLKRAS